MNKNYQSILICGWWFSRIVYSQLTLQSIHESTPHPFLSSDHDSIYYEADKVISIKLTHQHLRSKGAVADGSYYLLNAYEYYYVGALYLGGDHQPIPLIWDTGSEWLVVASY